MIEPIEVVKWSQNLKTLLYLKCQTLTEGSNTITWGYSSHDTQTVVSLWIIPAIDVENRWFEDKIQMFVTYSGRDERDVLRKALCSFFLGGWGSGGPVAQCSKWRSGGRRLSAPVKLSDSGTSGSRAGRAPESAATRTATPRAGDSASDTADLGGAGKLQYLPYLWGRTIKVNHEYNNKHMGKVGCI